MFNRRSHNHAATQGFTLIELLVVLVIMAIIATFAVLAIGYGARTARIKFLAQEIALSIPLAEQQAILTPTQIGILFTNKGYDFYHFVLDADSTTSGSWQKYKGSMAFNYQSIPDSVRVKVQLKDPNSTNIAGYDSLIKPQIIIFSSGDITPFQIFIGVRGQKPLYVINGKENGEVDFKRIDDKQSAEKRS